jgi:hypothetical protein
MSFIVQISPFVHLFTLKIVFRWGGMGLCPEPPHQYRIAIQAVLDSSYPQVSAKLTYRTIFLTFSGA